MEMATISTASFVKVSFWSYLETFMINTLQLEMSASSPETIWKSITSVMIVWTRPCVPASTHARVIQNSSMLIAYVCRC